MRKLTYLAITCLVIVSTFAAANAQFVGRTFGVRRLLIDAGDLVSANNVYLIDRLGSLGIDATGLTTPGFPSSCALLDLSSTSKGFLPPRMTNVQELAICGGSPPLGLIVVNTDKRSLDFYNGSAYASPWMTKGNFLTDPTVDFIGTNEATDFVFRTNLIERMRILGGGNISIGIPAAAASHLQVNEVGTQDAFSSIHTGTSGRAGFFSTFSGNSSPVLDVATTGTGRAGQFAISNVGSGATALNVSTTGTGTGVNITTGNSNNLLVVNGAANATVLNVAADPVWDSRIIGDQIVTGIQKVGGSIWLDGNSATHQIVANANINIGTRTGNTVNLVTGNTPRFTIDAIGNTTIAGGNTIINGGGSVTMNVGNTTINEGTGEFTVNGTGSGYAAKINTSSLQGLEIHCTSQTGVGLNSNTHFADFYDASSANARGSIQGQDLSDYTNDPIFIANTTINAANIVVAAAELVAAAASAATVVGIPEGVGFAAQAVGIAVQIAQFAVITGIETSQLGVSYQSSAGDYAEYLKRANTSEKLYPGDIVGVKNGLISKNTDGAQSVLSISLAPIVLGNVPPRGEEANYNKVGFLGQVPVKVMGIVHEGDFIIASGKNDGLGTAVAAQMITPEQFTMVIGRAWASSPLEGIKYIKVAVGLNAKTMSEIMSHEQTEIEALQKEVIELRKSNAEVTSMKAKLDRIEKFLSQPDQSAKQIMLRTN